MDAPILLTLGIKPREIARQAFNIESVQRLPLQFYEDTQKRADPKAEARIIETVQDRSGLRSTQGASPRGTSRAPINSWARCLTRLLCN
jgi:DNA polymerase II large subunit